YDSDGALFNRAQTQLGDPIYADDRFAVFNVPESTPLPSLVVYPPLGYNAFFDPDITYYLYTAQPGWYLAGIEYTSLQSNVIVSLNNEDFSLIMSTNDALSGSPSIVSMPLPLSSAGYYTIRLRLEHPCPYFAAPSQICNTPNITVTSGPLGFERQPYLPADSF